MPVTPIRARGLRAAALTVCFAALGSTLVSTTGARDAGSSSAIELIASDSDHVVLECRASDAGASARAGAPRPPSNVALIAIPAGADPQIRAGDGARITSTGTLRSQRYAVVEFVAPPPQRADIVFTYPGGKSAAAVGGAIAEPAFEDIFRLIFLNYDSARGWRVRSAPTDVAAMPTVRPGVGGDWLKLTVEKDAMYRVTCGDLRAAGVDLATLDVRTLKVYEQTRELAIRVRDANGNSRCDAQDQIEFWGRAAATRYTSQNVYWLTYGGVAGRRMREAAATASTGTLATTVAEAIHIDEPHHYLPYLPFRDDADHWFGENIPKSGGPNFVEYQFRADGVVADAPASIRLTLGATSAGDHHTVVAINGVRVGERAWTGANTVVEVISSFPAALLRANGTNVVRVEELLPYPNIVWTKDADITYGRALAASDDVLRIDQPAGGTWRYELSGFSSPPSIYDVTDPAAVVHLRGRQGRGTYGFVAGRISAPHIYVATAAAPISPLSIARDVPSDLRAPTNAADYLVIAPASFIPHLRPLVDLHAAHGLRVRVVDIQDVYDEFSGGRVDAQAIHDFLLTAYATWESPAPSYVLLAGDGHFDFKNVQQTNAPNPIPPYLRFVDPWWGETASDNRLVAFNRGNPLPALLIGRLPADTTADVDAMVDKIVAYAQHAPAGAWRSTMTLVADRAVDANGVADEAGNFWTFSDAIVDRLHAADPRVSTERIYFNPCPPASNPSCTLPYPTFSSADAARRAVIDAINDGRGLVQYVGHATFAQWSGAQLFSVRDLDQLHPNGGRYPVVLDMTCLAGYFHYPGIESLAEAAMRLAGRGPVAAWSPSGLGVATGHDALQNGFLDAVIRGVGGGIGADAFAGKQYLWLHGGGMNLDLIDTFNLFGDPAMPVLFGAAGGDSAGR